MNDALELLERARRLVRIELPGESHEMLDLAYDLLTRLITPESRWQHPVIERTPENGILLYYGGTLVDVEIHLVPSLATRIRLLVCPRCTCCELVWVRVQGRPHGTPQFTVRCQGNCNEDGQHEGATCECGG